MSMASIEVIQKQEKKKITVKEKKVIEEDKESMEDKEVPIAPKDLNEI